jgi:hypothetical protein
MIFTEVGKYLKKPGLELVYRIEPVQVFVGPDKSLLRKIIGVVMVSDHPTGEQVCPLLMPFDQYLERFYFSLERLQDKGVIAYLAYKLACDHLSPDSDSGYFQRVSVHRVPRFLR